MITWRKNNHSERNEDVCLNDRVLVEYYCRSAYRGKEYFLCENRCEKGACVPAACGNGLFETGEECDDGNIEVGDGCDNNCKIEAVVPYPGAALFEEPGYCRYFSEPGAYKVKPCDIFSGSLGINFKVEEIDEYGQVHGSYMDEDGYVKFEEIISSSAIPVAHYGLKLLHEGDGILTRTDNPKDLYDRCMEILSWHPQFDPPHYCSIVSPTEALEGEIIFTSEKGYFGKTNHSEHALLAECAARDLESTAINSSAFLGLPALEKGLAFMHLFTNKATNTGASFGSLSIWFYEYGNQESIDYEVKQCTQKLSSGEFAKGDHELTHLFTRGFDLPLTFNEGLANFVPDQLNSSEPMEWNNPNSFCKEQGLALGGKVLPYVKYYQDWGGVLSYYSGECFWQKLVHDYGSEIIPTVMGVFKMHVGRDLSFEEQLVEAGVDASKYQPWGLGKEK